MNPPGSLTLSRDFAVQLRRFSNTFIETGTYRGGGACAALDGGFGEVYSIEFSQALHHEARSASYAFRASIHSRAVLELHCGDSGVLLPKVLADVRFPAVVFLDSHLMIGDGEAETARGLHPLTQELFALKRDGRAHLVVVDDIDQCGHAGMPRRAEVERRLLEIHPYQFKTMRGARSDSVLVAQPEGFTL